MTNQSRSRSPRVAIVYDWATTPYGGAEQVLSALHAAFPTAPLFTTLTRPDRVAWLQSWQVVSSWLNRLPLPWRSHRWLAPLLPLAAESLSLSEYEVVISVTSGPAKGILTQPQQLHVCYLLTPPRYLYSHQQAYQAQLPLAKLSSKLAQPLLAYLRRVDQVSAWRPDLVIPISNLVADRVVATYSRSTESVIYPPIAATLPKNYDHPVTTPNFICVSRLVAYKRLDLAIEACAISGYRLKIIGDGPDRRRLQRLVNSLPGADQLITFVGQVTAEQLETHYEQATGLLMPGLEDFGITAAEAVTRGIPVLVHARSGVAEIIPDSAKVEIADETTSDVVAALPKLLTCQVDPDLVQRKLKKYDTNEFCRQWRTLVATAWRKHQKG